MGLAYERAGSGPPLVLLHGVGHRRQAWDAVLGRLTPHRDVIVVDLPGHGESPPLTLAGRPVLDAMLAEVTGLLDELGLDRPHVAGNSLGGRLALEAGVRGRAATVTALSPAGFWRNRGEIAYDRAVFKIMEFAGARTQRFAPAVPVMIAWGTRDRLLFPGQARVVKSQLPEALLVPLPGCGHVPMTDDPPLVADVLLRGSGRAWAPPSRG